MQEQLSGPERCGLLPAFPFGWRNSGLEVPDSIFWGYIINLLDSLRDDGFTRVYCLAPSGIDPQSSFITNNSAWILRQAHASMNQPKPLLPPDTERDKVILFPIGHTEQHGYHLPLSISQDFRSLLDKLAVSHQLERLRKSQPDPKGLFR